MTNKYYKPNDKELAHKVLEGEAIIINTADGTYYIINKIGTVIWQLIQKGLSKKEIINKVNNEYTSKNLKEIIEEFFDKLIKNDLIKKVEEKKRKENIDINYPEEFNKPVLKTYEDMADLLALDPPLPNMDE